MSLEQMAPPVEGPVLALGEQQGLSIESLAQGRRIYLTTCAKCHNVEPIGRYSLSRWGETLSEMSDEAKLNETQRRDLRAYVLTAHQALQKP